MPKLCEHCGASLGPDRKFCEECGALVAAGSPAPAQTPPENPARVEPAPNPAPEPAKHSPSIPVAWIVGAVVVVVVILAGIVVLPNLLLGQPGGGTTPQVTVTPTIKVPSPSVATTGVSSPEAIGNDTKATDEIARAVALSPGNDTVWVDKGFFEEGRKNYPEAITAFSKAIELEPARNKWLLFHIGLDYNMLGQYDMALQTWDEIFALSYFDQANIAMPEAWNQKGISLSGLGRYQEAVGAFDMAISLYPDHEFAWNSKGEALEALGRNSEAAAAYQKALDINPAFEDAKENLARIRSK